MVCHNVKKFVNYKIIWLICLAQEPRPFKYYSFYDDPIYNQIFVNVTPS